MPAKIVDREASARGGKARTAAKLDALAKLHRHKRALGAARIAALQVPVPFRDAPDFLITILEFVGQFPIGVTREIAARVGVDNSTVSKYLRCKVFPTQKKLDALIAWWTAKRAAHPGVKAIPAPARLPIRRPTAASRATLPAATGIGRKLSPPVAARLARAARLRNVAPERLADQILDRHLPSSDELSKAEGR